MNNMSIADIKREYHLDNLCIQNTAQLENAAIVIQSSLKSLVDLKGTKQPKQVEASLCRHIVIDSYSVIEDVIVCLAYKIQNKCLTCHKNCLYRSNSLRSSFDEHKNAMKAFDNGYSYLTKIGIISLTSDARAFYDSFRSSRNNVHLTRNAKIISKDPIYTIKNCEICLDYMKKLFQVMNTNYNEFLKETRCGR